jgi:hypothetical protein
MLRRDGDMDLSDATLLALMNAVTIDRHPKSGSTGD